MSIVVRRNSSRVEYRRSKACALLMILVFVISGCVTAPPNQEATSQWVEPAWMAAHRQETEQNRAALQSCFAEFGVTTAEFIGGGIMVINVGPVTAAMDALQSQAAEECHARYPEPALAFPNHSAEAYQRMLYHRNCLIAHDWEVRDDFPSFEVWAEQEIPRTPQMDLWNTGLSLATWREVVEACPQTDFFVMVSDWNH